MRMWRSEGLCEDSSAACHAATLSQKSQFYTHIYNVHIHVYVYKYKNEVGCRDDTMPKTVSTRRHCEEECEHATIFRNPQKQRCRDWVAEDCCMLTLLLAVPSCTYSFWHGVIPTSYFIFNDFYTCFTNFFIQA